MSRELDELESEPNALECTVVPVSGSGDTICLTSPNLDSEHVSGIMRVGVRFLVVAAGALLAAPECKRDSGRDDSSDARVAEPTRDETAKTSSPLPAAAPKGTETSASSSAADEAATAEPRKLSSAQTDALDQAEQVLRWLERWRVSLSNSTMAAHRAFKSAQKTHPEKLPLTLQHATGALDRDDSVIRLGPSHRTRPSTAGRMDLLREV